VSSYRRRLRIALATLPAGVVRWILFFVVRRNDETIVSVSELETGPGWPPSERIEESSVTFEEACWDRSQAVTWAA